MKKLIFILVSIMLFLVPNFFVDAEEIFTNVNKVTYQLELSDNEIGTPLYKSLKLSNGDYLIVDGYNEWVNDGCEFHLILKRVGKISWDAEFVKVTSTGANKWVYPEHSDFQLINDDELLLINNNAIRKINLNNGEIIKENTELSGFKIQEYNGNFLCVGDSFFYGDNGTNGLFIIDSDLNLIKDYKVDNSSNVMGTFIDDKIYSLVETEGENYTSTYSLVTFNSNLEVDSEVKITLKDVDSFITYGVVDFFKLGTDFYYVCHEIIKITDVGEASYFKGNAFEAGVDYTAMKKFDDYIVLTGLNQDADEKIGALVEVYDLQFNLLQSIDVNVDFGFDKQNSNAMSIVKGIDVLNDGFVISGLINGDKQFVAEYKKKYSITTKTDGNGELIVSSNEAYSDEEIEFTVKANDGYKIDSIKVVDSDGNEIKISNNKFIMPSNDVVIEALFVKESIFVNPPTSDIIIPVFVVICISGFILFRHYKGFV